MDCAALPDELRIAVPEFGPVIDEHTADYEEVLPHLLVADLTRFVLAAHERGDDAQVQRALAILEHALIDGDPAVQNVVQVSFVENLKPWDEASWPFIETLPAALRREAESQRSWEPDSSGS